MYAKIYCLKKRGLFSVVEAFSSSVQLVPRTFISLVVDPRVHGKLCIDYLLYFIFGMSVD